MATLPNILPQDPTLAAINSAIENINNLSKPRPYLGMSAIGMDCERYLWGIFRWCTPAGGGFDAKALRNFEDGHRSEDLMAERLRMVPGVKLYTLDPSSGKQFGFSGHGGHFRGHIDGAIQGILQAPKTFHVWEHKSSEKGPTAIDKIKAEKGEKVTLKEWHPVYYAQAILYMDYGQMERHYLTCTAPGGRMPETSIRTDANPQDAAMFNAKAERVIFSAEPLTKLSDDPAFWKCKGCSMATQCHSTALPAVSCRTCLHATPERDGDGRWSCAKWRDEGGSPSTIPLEAQQTGCGEHRYIPALLKRWGEVMDASETENWVSYEAPDGFTFRNGAWGEHSFTSKELAACNPSVLRDPEFQAIRATTKATIIDRAEWPEAEAA